MTRKPFPPSSKPTASTAVKLTAKIYGVMVVTTLGTFATLSTIYELFFRPDIFA